MDMHSHGYEMWRGSLHEHCPEMIALVRCTCGLLNDPDYSEEDHNDPTVHARNCRKRECYRECGGWILSPFDTVHQCVHHGERATEETHPEYEPPEDQDWHGLGCAEQIVAQCKVDAARAMRRKLVKQRDTFYPESKGKPQPTARLNAEIAKVDAHIASMVEREFDRWDDRCQEWASDIDFWPGQ